MEQQIWQEQKKTNELLEKLIVQNKDPNELLTVEQVHKEFEIGINMVRKMFQYKELAVQTYIVPFKVTGGEFNNYLSKRHDYLSEKEYTSLTEDEKRFY